MLNGTVDIIQQNPYCTIGTSIANIPIGLIELYYPNVDLGYKIDIESDVFEIKFDVWDEYVASNNLYGDIMRALAFMNFGLLSIIKEIHTQENIEAIKNLIYRARNINSFSSNDIPLSKFIIERSSLSRSLVMKAISELRNAGYIELKNGRLVNILKEL